MNERSLGINYLFFNEKEIFGKWNGGSRLSGGKGFFIKEQYKWDDRPIF